MDMIRKIDECHGCGEMVLFIKCMDRKTHTADPEPVWIRQTDGGKTFITRDGRFVFGEIAGDAYDEEDPDANLIRCYEPHKGKCPNGGRKRRRTK